MMSRKREWVRSFEIGPPFLPPKSKQVVFQVTSLIFPVGFPEAATKLVVKKKFSDFQSLHKSLSDIHKNLYLKGKFPSLPKSSKGYFKSPDNAGNSTCSVLFFKKYLYFIKIIFGPFSVS
jgi:hypothetical protein